jgi:hypothetical protein
MMVVKNWKGKYKPMNKSILEAMFYGKTRCFGRKAMLSDERRELNEKIMHQRDCLEKTLSDDGKRYFEKYEALQSESTTHVEIGGYSHGFITATLLIFEILSKCDNVILDEL